MAYTKQEIIQDLMTAVVDEPKIEEAINTVAAIPVEQRKPSDYSKCVRTILEITEPLADSVADHLKS